MQEARYLLRAAAEVELALLAQYLYAAYSAKASGARGKLVQIAKEEMGHLLCVQNLLGAVGSRPYFDRKNYPISTADQQKFYPYAFTLEPLSLASLAKYVATESPFLELIDDQELKNRVAPVIAQGKAAAQTVINHVGALFVALYWLFKADDTPPTEEDWPKFPTPQVLAILGRMNKSNWHVKDEDFATFAELNKWQADEGAWTGGNTQIFVRPVGVKDGKVDRSTILKTLSSIAAQGEGWTSIQDSHFERFLALFEQIKALPPGSPVALDVPTPPGQPVPTNYITSDEAIRWARLFNARYQMVLLQLTLAVTLPKAQPADSSSPRNQLIKRVIRTEMVANLSVMATQLVVLRRQGQPSATKTTVVAGPPFELPKDALPDREPALWKRLRDLIAETKSLCQEIVNLQIDPGNPSDRGLVQQFLDPANSPDADLLKLIETVTAQPGS